MFANSSLTGCVFFAVATGAFSYSISASAGTLRDSYPAQEKNKRENQKESFHSILAIVLCLSVCLSVSLSLKHTHTHTHTHTHNHSFKRCKIYAGKFAIFCTYGELDKWGLILETFVIIFSPDRNIQQN